MPSPSRSSVAGNATRPAASGTGHSRRATRPSPIKAYDAGTDRGMTFTAEDDAIPSADQKIIKTVKCRGYAFCGELGDESPAEVTGVATLSITVQDISMKQS